MKPQTSPLHSRLLLAGLSFAVILAFLPAGLDAAAVMSVDLGSEWMKVKTTILLKEGHITSSSY